MGSCVPVESLLLYRGTKVSSHLPPPPYRTLCLTSLFVVRMVATSISLFTYCGSFVSAIPTLLSVASSQFSV